MAARLCYIGPRSFCHVRRALLAANTHEVYWSFPGGYVLGQSAVDVLEDHNARWAIRSQTAADLKEWLGLRVCQLPLGDRMKFDKLYKLKGLAWESLQFTCRGRLSLDNKEGFRHHRCGSNTSWAPL